MQYGSQMVLSFYGAALSRHMREQLNSLNKFSSISRKAFWVLKSIDNISTALKVCDMNDLKIIFNYFTITITSSQRTTYCILCDYVT